MSKKVLISFSFIAITSVFSISLLVFKNINVLHFQNMSSTSASTENSNQPLITVNNKDITQTKAMMLKQKVVIKPDTMAEKKALMLKKQMMAKQQTMADKKALMLKKQMMAKQQTMTQKKALMLKKQMMAKQQTMADKKALMLKKQMMDKKAAMMIKESNPIKREIASVPVSVESVSIFKKLGFFTETKIITGIMKDVAYCLLVIFGFLFFITSQFITNLKEIFKMQSKLFNHFKDNKFDQFIPILNHDEFGLISNEVNDIVLKLKDKQRIKSIFGKYISPSIASKLLDQKSEIKLGGSKKNVSILFCDIRNYTTLSEQLEPQTLVTLLNEYFTEMVNIVHKHDGILDKFIGDAFMAFFDNKLSAQKSTLAALEIKKAAENLKQKWQKNGAKDFNVGIGLNFGEVIMGNIGSKERLEYTVIGDAVNIAARLESETKIAHSPILISETIYSQLSAEHQQYFTHYGTKSLKGKSETVSTYKYINSENKNLLNAA